MTSRALTAVSLVGLGALGTPIATRLADAGLALSVYDIDLANAKAFAAAHNARAAQSLAECVGADLYVCLLPDSTVVDSVMVGEGRLFEVAAAGSMILDMGSSDPRRTIQLAGQAAALGIDFADAPVSGGLARARTGELTVMFGGSEELLARARPVFDAVASSVVRVGEVGAGHAMKALNNLLSAIGLAAAAEVMEVGRRFGLDSQIMLDVLNTSTGGNNATQTKFAQYVLSQSFASGFRLGLMVKDMSIAVDLGRDFGVDLPLSRLCLDRWRWAAGLLPNDADQTRFAALTYGNGAADITADNRKESRE